MTHKMLGVEELTDYPPSRVFHTPGKRESWTDPLVYERDQWPDAQAALSAREGAPFALINSLAGIDPLEILSGLAPIRPSWALRARHLLGRLNQPA